MSHFLSISQNQCRVVCSAGMVLGLIWLLCCGACLKDGKCGTKAKEK